MSKSIQFQRQVQRHGMWSDCGRGPTLDDCHESAMGFAARQSKGDDFYSLPKRTLKITTVTTVEIVEQA